MPISPTILAIWDITKYEKNSEKDYSQLLEECFRSVRSIIPPQTIVIWLTAVSFLENYHLQFL